VLAIMVPMRAMQWVPGRTYKVWAEAWEMNPNTMRSLSGEASRRVKNEQPAHVRAKLAAKGAKTLEAILDMGLRAVAGEEDESGRHVKVDGKLIAAVVAAVKIAVDAGGISLPKLAAAVADAPKAAEPPRFIVHLAEPLKSGGDGSTGDG
jgi:hypothetical protein